jgi:hypothetical protein
MTIEDARRRWIEKLWSPSNQYTIDVFTKKGFKMTLDETLVNVSHTQNTNEYHYGDNAILWEKAASIATLKMNRVVSVQECILMHIAYLEAKVAAKPVMVGNMIEIMSLYGSLTGSIAQPVQTAKVDDETLAKIEHDLMQTLAPPEDHHE